MACHTRGPGRRLNVDFSVKGSNQGSALRRWLLDRSPAARITTGSYKESGKSRKIRFPKGRSSERPFLAHERSNGPGLDNRQFHAHVDGEGITGVAFCRSRCDEAVSPVERRNDVAARDPATGNWPRPRRTPQRETWPIGVGTTSPRYRTSEHWPPVASSGRVRAQLMSG
jgi:hypothetical protein